jgi:uncharacterized protein (TIGR02246 family)
MKSLTMLTLAVVATAAPNLWAQPKPAPAQQPAVEAPAQPAEPAEFTAIRERLQTYVEVFNKHDAKALGEFWADDAVAVSAGERTTGREALVGEFTQLFQSSPTVRLTGQVQGIRLVRPDVAMVDGQTTLVSGDEEPAESSYSAVLVNNNGQWLISSSQEQNAVPPATPYDALKGLEWLVGTWKDQSDAADVQTTTRWSRNRAFLIRSFQAQFEEGDVVEGTQVIGWDPAANQIRTWNFNSDGSFGEGTASKSGEDWLLKSSQLQPDGTTSASTQVITRVNDDTLSVQTIGETVGGVPVPASPALTVVRIATPEASAEKAQGGAE